MLEVLRPYIYKVLLYLDIPFEFMPIHDDCLVIATIAEMEQFEEVLCSVTLEPKQTRRIRQGVFRARS